MQVFGVRSALREYLWPRDRRLTNDAVIHEQFPSWRRGASDVLDPLGRQSVKEPTSRAGNRRSDHQLEFVDDACGQQRLSDRDAGVDADIAAGLVLQLTDELDQTALDDTCIRPIPGRAA